MNEIPNQVECALFEAKLTGIYEQPTELLARSAGRIAAAAHRYSSRLAKSKRRSSDAQLRRIDQLEQCAQFFWMCCEAVEANPDFAVQLLDLEELPRWGGRQNGTQSLFQRYQCQSYTSVLGACLDTLLALATDRYMPDLFGVADLQCLLTVALRFPQPEIRFVTPSGDVIDVVEDQTPERIRGLIDSSQ